MTEEEKMLAGKLYDPTDKTLAAKRAEAHRLSKEFNDTLETEETRRAQILAQLVPNRGGNAYFQGPIQFDYGVFTTVGRNFYANFNFTVLDCCPVTIGDNVFFGPNCSVVTPIHPLLPRERNIRYKEDGSPYDLEYAAPIVIKDNCWISSNVVICGGVTIGEGCVIGAGSVVTRDIPAGMFAAGVPCKPVRPITDSDSVERRRELL